MNIFRLDWSNAKSAEYHFDRHVVKMPVEIAQMLSTACHVSGLEAPYAATHAAHPMTKWCGASRENFEWALDFGFKLCGEYTYRFGRSHAASRALTKLSKADSRVFDSGLVATEFPLCMPDEFKRADPIEAYRRYYVFGKPDHLHAWRKRGCPEWFVRLMATG